MDSTFSLNCRIISLLDQFDLISSDLRQVDVMLLIDSPKSTADLLLLSDVDAGLVFQTPSSRRSSNCYVFYV
jgi:hypothetical protein